MSKIIEQPRFSCALGAQQTVLAIKKGVPIVHSGPGCSRHVYGLLQRGQGYVGGNNIPCTNADESDVIFGGEEKLDKVIDGAFKIIDGDIFVVLTGCTADIVGDDIGSVVSKYQEEGKPIVYLETGGFKSNNFVSHSAVVNAIIDQYVDKYKDSEGVKRGLVNVFSSIPYQDIFWNGNLKELKRVLEGIGLEVNILFGIQSKGIEEWKKIPNAEFNLVVNSWVGLEVAENLKSKYNTPYLHFPYLPIGAIETSKLLREVGDFAKLDKESVEIFIEREEEVYYETLDDAAEFLLEFRYGLPNVFYVLSDSSYVIGFSRFLINELGIMPGKQFVIEDTPEKYIERVTKEFENISKRRKVDVEFTVDAGLAQEKIKELQENNHGQFDLYTFGEGERSDKHLNNRALILGSAWEKDLSERLNADYLTIAAPFTYRLVLSGGYVGYNGGLRAIEDIYDKVLGSYN